ncbi:MAG: Gfo/Idh/MocA family oxidoreductase [Pyrinomonadaceae bacterium]|nr:Gfo/Idh/MocA family oxidoreductase [Pyrinomonadaceae bacterium]
MFPVKLGIISTARINERCIHQVLPHTENVELLAVASRKETVAQEYCHFHRIPKAYGKYEEMLADPELDAVYISVPNALHGKLTRQALEYGKHVLCEKPFSSNPSETIEIKKAAKERNLYVAEAMHYRYHPSIREAVANIQAGIIGELTGINIKFVWDLRNLADIRLDPSLDGGALMDVGCYCIDFFRWLSGNDEWTVLETSAEYAESGVDTSIDCKLVSSDNIETEFYCSLSAENFACSAEIRGTEGTILLRYPFLPVVSDSQVPGVLFSGEINGQAWNLDVPLKTSYHYQLSNFIRRIQNGSITPQSIDSDYYENAVMLNRIKLKLKETRFQPGQYTEGGKREGKSQSNGG